jgi:hypothetical protein
MGFHSNLAYAESLPTAPTSGGRGASRSCGSRDGMLKACEPNMPGVVDERSQA